MSDTRQVGRDARVDVAVNQVGFVPGAAKFALVPGGAGDRFEVLQLETGQVVLGGELRAGDTDFGRFAVADFSAVRAPGTYVVRAGASRSYPFRIAPDAYDGLQQTIVAYFARQRCGPSATGYLAPCHCDDGLRLDDGQHQDVTGGWHDASDLRKWVGATLYGMVGLARLLEVRRPAWDRGEVMDELRWGNRYFLNMQEPDGFVMSHVGGDVLAHGDSNRWTDNAVVVPGGQAVTIPPAPGGSSGRVSVFPGSDDRVIQTKPLDLAGQYTFVLTQAAMARLCRTAEPAYADRCLTAARRCFAWCRVHTRELNPDELGTAAAAALELFRTTADPADADAAAASARQLLALQVTEPLAADASVRGYFRTSPSNPKPFWQVWHGHWHAVALADLLESLPDHPDAPRWRTGLDLYLRGHLLPIAGRNPCGIVPLGLFADQDPGGNRRLGPLWYRYFMTPVAGWWVGINANLAGAGVALARASRVLGDPSLEHAAQRQLDWVLGANPLGASTVEGIGHNHPERFVNTTEFRPPTPRIPGAVMNGLGGTPDDQPAPWHGHYHTAEYWTPMVAYTLWLAAELSA